MWNVYQTRSLRCPNRIFVLYLLSRLCGQIDNLFLFNFCHFIVSTSTEKTIVVLFNPCHCCSTGHKINVVNSFYTFPRIIFYKRNWKMALKFFLHSQEFCSVMQKIVKIHMPTAITIFFIKNQKCISYQKSFTTYTIISISFVLSSSFYWW